MMWNWDEQACYDLVMMLLDQLSYSDEIGYISWLTRVASCDDDETELRLVAKICSGDNISVLRVNSGERDQLRARIRYQELLHQSGASVPAVLNVTEAELPDRLTVTAYLEEWIEGVALSSDDFIQYAALLGELHDYSRLLTGPFLVERNHLLYDTRQIATEMKNKLCTKSAESKRFTEIMTVLMTETKAGMERLKRYPVHGDYSTNNLIKKGESLFLIDFGRSGFGYLPEEAGEAFAEMACSFFDFYQWKERLDEFLSAYCSRIHISESELKLTRAVAAISSVIRVLHTEQDEKTIMLLCGDILNESRG